MKFAYFHCPHGMFLQDIFLGKLQINKQPSFIDSEDKVAEISISSFPFCSVPMHKKFSLKPFEQMRVAYDMRKINSKYEFSEALTRKNFRGPNLEGAKINFPEREVNYARRRRAQKIWFF